MEWSGPAILCSVGRHGEHGAVIRVLSESEGLWAGFVLGGMGKRLRATLEPGNDVSVQWRARLAEHLGTIQVELAKSRVGRVMSSSTRLAALSAVTAVTASALPERQAYPGIYEALGATLDIICEADKATFAAAVIRYELGLLSELGFGLDLSSCAATGVTEDLVYVSPRSARAVSAAAGAPYHDRMLPLPRFLLGSQAGAATPDALAQGFRLTGHFLENSVFAAKDMKLPAARQRLPGLLVD